MTTIRNLETEQSIPLYADLDVSSTSEILRLMNQADQSVPIAVERVLDTVARGVELIVDTLSHGGRLIYIGAGTSGRLGVLDAVECLPTFNIPPDRILGIIAGGERAMFRAVEEAEDQAISAHEDLASVDLQAGDIVVGVSASGRTKYVAGGLSYAHSVGARTISISCNRDAEMSRLAEVAIEIDTGPEVLAGSTRLKAGTAEKLVLNMLSTASMIRMGKTYRNMMVDMRVTNEKLFDRAVGIVMRIGQVEQQVAEQALHEANGQVKHAVLMVRKSVGYETAAHMLVAANGVLRAALG
ncbi:MAG: N-acetylmuramic acid 6-phosphate etherase [Firmicutes bacterium]|nr:N-acetylmuramic acid 6-phosphate etherase [Bacillota bacterium]